MAEYKATGGCLCGGVKYEFTKPLSQVSMCHCSMCRKAIGADFGTYGGVPFTHFKMLKDDTLRDYQSSAKLLRSFCSVCGASVLAKTNTKEVENIYLNLGCVDGDPGATIQFHMFVNDKAPWVKLNDDLPKRQGYE